MSNTSNLKCVVLIYFRGAPLKISLHEHLTHVHKHFPIYGIT